MKITIIAVGHHIPEWVNNGYQEYIDRLPKHLKPKMIEIPLQKRTKEQEGEIILENIPKDSFVIALDPNGKPCSTEKLSEYLQKWQAHSQSITFLIGGPDGLSEKCLQKSQMSLSLSMLTFPHALVRIILAEQLYRAWTILTNHPYHRV